ncbi:MAG TPA: hypothetical protein VIU61_03780, partial [Kofleriaceae bacterium]
MVRTLVLIAVIAACSSKSEQRPTPVAPDAQVVAIADAAVPPPAHDAAPARPTSTFVGSGKCAEC